MNDITNNDNLNHSNEEKSVELNLEPEQTPTGPQVQDHQKAAASFQESSADAQAGTQDTASSAQAKADSRAIASLVLGIVSIVFGWWTYVSLICLALGIVGLVLGVKARKESPTGIATGGIVTSIIGICFSGVFLSCVLTTAAGLACLATLR